ncbi:MAG: polyribonucleotide nucleotidyltransferase, partial [Alphaproteobacteria bacterium]|nr:polyribonucleotide nucleotidyltransferase [Alphaproteobacteria bacterium]
VYIKCIGIDDRGKVRLSMRVVDQDSGADIEDQVPKRSGPPSRDGGDRRGGGGDRGGDRRGGGGGRDRDGGDRRGGGGDRGGDRDGGGRRGGFSRR